jgi:hypothetical protein
MEETQRRDTGGNIQETEEKRQRYEYEGNSHREEAEGK